MLVILVDWCCFDCMCQVIFFLPYMNKKTSKKELKKEKLEISTQKIFSLSRFSYYWIRFARNLKSKCLRPYCRELEFLLLLNISNIYCETSEICADWKHLTHQIILLHVLVSVAVCYLPSSMVSVQLYLNGFLLIVYNLMNKKVFHLFKIKHLFYILITIP